QSSNLSMQLLPSPISRKRKLFATSTAAIQQATPFPAPKTADTIAQVQSAAMFPGRTQLECAQTTGPDGQTVYRFSGPVMFPPLELASPPTSTIPDVPILEPPPTTGLLRTLSLTPSSLLRPVAFASNPSSSAAGFVSDK